jgi:hypothetical protein
MEARMVMQLFGRSDQGRDRERERGGEKIYHSM